MPNRVEADIILWKPLNYGNANREGPALEQKYVNVSRRGGGSRVEAGRSGSSKRPKARRRSPVKSALLGFYKFIVAVSALIVAVFIGFRLMVSPPEQAQGPQTVPVGNQTGGNGGGQEDENALVRRDLVYNVLLAATDNGSTRTDTMMVMSYDIPNQKVGVISIPRDTLVDRESGSPKLVYGSGGVTQRVADISDMLGVPIDYYIKVDINGFIALVDYLGGVEVEIPLDMNYDDPYQDLHIHFTQGTHLLDGQEAMEVARYRHDNSDSPNYNKNQWYTDIQRTQMQQQILVNLAKKVLSWDSLTRINGFVEIFNEYVDTDLSLTDMLYFAAQAIYLDTSTGVETFTLEGDGQVTYKGTRYCYELDPQSTLEAVNRLINPYTRDLTLEDMNILQA